MNARVFIEKKQNYNIEERSLLNELNTRLNLQIQELRMFNVYDLLNVTKEDLELATDKVLAEKQVDIAYSDIDLSDKHYFASELIPGTFDQRAQGAIDCLDLLTDKSNVEITTSRLYVFDGITEQELQKVKNYIINPNEAIEKDLTTFEIKKTSTNKDVTEINGFINLNEEELELYFKSSNFSMTIDDLKHIQNYFRVTEDRNPNELEIRLLDTYWSDHCRHSTFETELVNIALSGAYKEDIRTALLRYFELSQFVNAHKSPKIVTLMDMATVYGKYLRKTGKLEDMEVSEENNACSIYVDIKVNGQDEKWLVMFKNETHNHPTEIEPFGGASTCVGGAIRDPLSGRSYVYQAMRVSGAGNILEPFGDTLEGKLPQGYISTVAAKGYSSYGNQIGLAATHVREIYHEGYKAKHMEVGAVVGAVKASSVRRETPQPGDIVIMLGGKTGRDGIGGATGSSKEQNDKSLELSAAEVQKGNAIEERMIQRLFRNEKVTKLIKKSNDFGAGGVCVAIGEIADGVDIYLDKVPTKYDGLNPLEIALSESQERMSVVVSKEDAATFIELAQQENVVAVEIAVVTDNRRLRMFYQNNTVVDISRDFIDTNGVRQKASVHIVGEDRTNIFKRNIEGNTLREQILNNLKDMNVASQKAMIENFDSTIGASTVLMPFGGKTQLTESVASVQKLPVEGHTDTCTILTYGYNPYISSTSPFIGAVNAVVESVAKQVAVGGDYTKIRFSFQEYFERLGYDPLKWAKPVTALLGSIHAQDMFGLPAIGGKDSMSGTYKDINVPPTLISFAVSHTTINDIVSQEFKEVNSNIYLVNPTINEELIDIKQLKESYDKIHSLVKANKIKAMYPLGNGGLSEALVKMSLGNQIGFTISTDLDLFNYNYGAIVIETNEELNDFIYLGKTTNEVVINNVEFTIDELTNANTTLFESIYKSTTNLDKETFTNPYQPTLTVDRTKSNHNLTEVKVLLPVFPGTNSELDMANAFRSNGGTIKQFVFRNRNNEEIKASIKELARLIDETNILVFSGGFSMGDEPDGSGKFIANVISNEQVKQAIERLLSRDGLILGVCNGFQALVKSGLLPFGKVGNVDSNDATLFKNDINRHISHIARTVVNTSNSPWLSSFTQDDVHSVAVSHGEGKFVISAEQAKELFENDQVAFQYVDETNTRTMNGKYNPNGSTYAIEGIVSKCGRILGKMGHSERYSDGVYKNIVGNTNQNIFKNAINYFKGE